MKELKLEELTIEQKIGMVTCAYIAFDDRIPESEEFVFELIKNRALGCLWIYPNTDDFDDIIAKVKELADYPILIATDAENGLYDYRIGQHNSIGMTDSEELAYEFGKVTAVAAHQKGYNVVCNPLLDMCKGVSICAGNSRTLGSNKYRVSELAGALAQGMHDGGVLTVGKHYPGAKGDSLIDSHMAESSSAATKEDLLDYNLFPYMELTKKGLLDGIMTSHCKLYNIDPDYPASLSKKVIGIIREQGFDGFAITDSLEMMGIVAKFGADDSKGLAVENGNDIALVWTPDHRIGYNAVYESYKKGIISEERLNEAVKKVLEAQHKVFTMQPKFTEITQEDKDAIERIRTDSIYAKTDDGLSTSISRDGKHLFVVMAQNDAEISEGRIPMDTFSESNYNPAEIMNRLEELFPNSEAIAVRQFPSGTDNWFALSKSVNFDDVVFITYMSGGPCMGREEFTPPFISLMESMLASKLVSTVLHIGNPYALENLPHIPRIIIGNHAKKCISTTLEVLAGNYPAKGTITYPVDFK